MPTRRQWEIYLRRRKLFKEVLNNERKMISDADFRAIITRTVDSLPSGMELTSTHPLFIERKRSKTEGRTDRVDGMHCNTFSQYASYLWSMKSHLNEFRTRWIKHKEGRFVNVVDEAREESTSAVNSRLSGWWRGGYGHPIIVESADGKNPVGFDGNKTFRVSAGFHAMTLRFPERVVDSVCIVDIRGVEKMGLTETAVVMGFTMKAGNGGYRQKYKFEYVQGFIAVDRQWNLYAFSSVSRDRAVRTLNSRVIKKVDERLEGTSK